MGSLSYFLTTYIKPRIAATPVEMKDANAAPLRPNPGINPIPLIRIGSNIAFNPVERIININGIVVFPIPLNIEDIK
jgi:hypothetical protein